VASDASEFDFDGLIVDLDGVVWVGASAVPGSVAAIRDLRARGVRLLFLTNDPRSSRAEYVARLSALGIAAEESEIVSVGKRAGLTTILVLTGTSRRDDIDGAEAAPDFVLPDLAALANTNWAG
jgi:ribonucleotide monophosphatase NagD (HAD superfamily)